MSTVLQGPDRIELSARLGRPIRQGSPLELRVSDYRIVGEAILQQDPERALGYLYYLREGTRLMIDIAVEWPLSWFSFLARERSEEAARLVMERTLGYFQGYLGAVPSETGRRLGQEVLAVLASIDSSTLERHRAGPRVDEAFRLRADQRVESLKEALQAGDFARAAGLWQLYFEENRWLHDHLFRISWSFGSVLNALHGQPLAQEGMHRSLLALSFYEPAWESSAHYTPAEMAAVLADHLRAHFSGPGREGSVEILEEEDRFRLVFDPCGSGGALRRETPDQEGFGRFSEPSPYTWSRRDVPVYCSHCAVNELEGLRRLGYPRWVTEFDPDPARPCGWTLYKDPRRIPEEYFRRLGVEKPYFPSSGGQGRASSTV